MRVCAASAINNYCVHVNYYCLRKQLALVCIPRASKQLILTLRLRDTIWNVFRTQNAITHSAHLHYGYKWWSTDREAPCVYTHPEGIGYFVGTVFHGRSNFVNFWTKIWPAEQLRVTRLTVFNLLEGQTECFYGSVDLFLRNNLLSSKSVYTSWLFASVKLQQPTILKWLRQGLHCPSNSTLATRSLQIHKHWTLFMVKKGYSIALMASVQSP